MRESVYLLFIRSVEMAPAQETLFRGDEGLLRQMLLNLLDNAVKYTPSGGRVGVELSKRDSAFEIKVSDTGAGISPEAQSHIFERFYRSDKARSRGETANGAGAGLGLTIARRVAEAHSGNLSLLRSDAAGSIFSVVLPNSQTVHNKTGFRE